MILPKVKQIILNKIKELEECILDAKITMLGYPTRKDVSFCVVLRRAIYNMERDLKILKIQANRLTKRMGDLK